MAAPQFIKVKITNNAPGARFFHGRDGMVQVAAGASSPAFLMSKGELEDAANNKEYDIRDGDAADEPDPSDLYPEDLRSTKSRDGLVSRDKLLEVAKKEGVEVGGDDEKPAIADKIVAKRAEVAGA